MTQREMSEIPEYWLESVSILGKGLDSHQKLSEMFYDLLLIIKNNLPIDLCVNEGEIRKRVKKMQSDKVSCDPVTNPIKLKKGAEANQEADYSCIKLPISDHLEQVYYNVVSQPAAQIFFTLSNQVLGEDRTVALWLSYKGSDTLKTEDATHILSEVIMICIEFDLSHSQENNERVERLFDLIAKSGFTPLVRDMKSGDVGFYTIFIRDILAYNENVLQLLYVYTRGGEREKSKEFGATPIVSSKNTPVIVPCFNNPTYCEAMLQQLLTLGFERITYVDNSSNSEDMLEWLEETRRSGVQIEKLTKNLGPKKSVFTKERLRSLPRWFCVTDPDLTFNKYLPPDFLPVMTEELLKYDAPKIGFALDISKFQRLRPEKFLIGDRLFTIREWESQFWKVRLGFTSLGDAVYKAEVDTTFALYNQDKFNLNDFLTGIRVGGKFTALHCPWLVDNTLSDHELSYYKKTQKFSFYSSD